MFGFITIREGQRVALWNKNGKVTFVDGPRRIFLFRQICQELHQYSAEAHEYLVVEFNDGRQENHRGPAAVWFNPVRHKSIRIENALAINSHEAIVVYRRNGEDVTRRVVNGPTMYVPTENEWLHHFQWHGADPKNPNRKIPSALKFTKLRVIPDQMYFDVITVRTKDDALLTIKLMLFFELTDIEKMLNQTHDPVADFINALAADIVDFVSKYSFEEFKGTTDALNELSTYANLVRRAERIGYQINKVVYRGYEASNKLQAMHDDAIEARTALMLESETEEQAQELADLKLQREAQRSARERELEQQQAEHKERLERMAHQETLRQARAEQEQKICAQRESNTVELEHLEASNTEKLKYLSEMKGMQVDLTRYLVAQYQNPDRLIRITGDQNPQLHLHEN